MVLMARLALGPWNLLTLFYSRFWPYWLAAARGTTPGHVDSSRRRRSAQVDEAIDQ